ncbi:MAG TPA: AraC family transcriptional regulator [Candidatus Saccharimonadia bacterium]|nr:AraC family transcriptional regulator [Candidatus Saccharimonadia bacterium]
MTATSYRPTTLHGDLRADGFRIRIWQFQAGRDTRLEFGISSESTVMAMSFTGRLVFASSDGHVRISSEQLVVASKVRPETQWIALEGGRHRGLMVELAPQMLAQLGGTVRGPEHQVAQSVTVNRIGQGDVSRVPTAVLSLAQQLSTPPAHTACLPIWFQAKVMELASLTLFAPAINPMKKPTEPAGGESLERALFLLERDLENPPTLEMLAQEVGCGPFHLSRLFGRITGKTMPEFLRQKRMERAAVMLRTTRQSVSEIALAVGYESFSAFTRAFVREVGSTPTSYRAHGGVPPIAAQSLAN